MIILATIIDSTLNDLQVYPDLDTVFNDMYDTLNVNLDEYAVYESNDPKPATWKVVKDWKKAYEKFALGLDEEADDDESEDVEEPAVAA